MVNLSAKSLAIGILYLFILFIVIARRRRIDPDANVAPTPTTTVLKLVSQDISIGGSNLYSFKSIVGNGSNWKMVDNVGCFVIENYTKPFQVVYQNNLNVPSIIHAHGLTPPSLLDGAPYISSLPLAPGHQQLVTYTLQEHNVGTNFLHSHYGFQLGEGMAIPLIVKGNMDKNYPLYNQLQSAQESVMFLQDVYPYFGSRSAHLQMEKSAAPLQNGVQKNNIKAVYDRLLAESRKASSTKGQCPNVVPATKHVVHYRAVIANGKTLEDPVKLHVKPGQYVRIRIINAAGMTTFKIKIPSLLRRRVYIVSVDGQLVHPLQMETFWISTGQRVDLLVHAPGVNQIGKDDVFPILAISESMEPSLQAGIILYTQNTYPTAAANPPLISDTAVGFMDMNMEIQLQAWYPLPAKSVDRIFNLKLTSFNSLNNHSYKMVPEAPYEPNPYPLRVQDGERVQINLLNNDVNGHPIHLHGHSFQVIQIDGKPINGAVRDTVFVQAGCHNVSIIFDADNPGIWPLHCHFEYHMTAGMVTTVEYYNSTQRHIGW
jgi:FtsP/CotA-like multicopper oxidase with cupredoxin domain